MRTVTRPNKWSAIVLLTVASLFLAACGVGVANNNWPGLTAEGDVVYVAYGPEVLAVNIAERIRVGSFPPAAEGVQGVQYYAAPDVNDGRIVFGDYGQSGSLLSLSPGVTVRIYSLHESGEGQPWINDSAASDKIVAPALQVGGQVIVGTADNFVLALDSQTGALNWEFETDHSIWAQPIYDDGIIYVGSLDKQVYALDADRGTQIWQSNVGGSVSDQPGLESDLVYVGSFDKQVHALEKQSGESRWTAPAEAAVWAAPQLDGQVVYYVDLGGNVFAVDAGSGEQLWQFSTGQYVVGAPTVLDGTVFIAGAGDPNVEEDQRQGTLTALASESGEQLWQTTFPFPIFTSPVVANESIVVAYQPGPEPNVVLAVIDPDDPSSLWNFTAGESGQ